MNTLFPSSPALRGNSGGQLYTPSCFVRCLDDMLAPYNDRIYDPACVFV